MEYIYNTYTHKKIKTTPIMPEFFLFEYMQQYYFPHALREVLPFRED